MDEFETAVEALRARATAPDAPQKPVPPPTQTIRKGMFVWRDIAKPEPAEAK